ncbi:MAG: ABC transporter ATP-binding protein, partial [Tissierellia bacterium]|nr:ABC transporter ATP-binding protein [Tissierellia bacterium]
MKDKILIDKISYSYGKYGKKIFDNFSLQLNNGEVTILIGKNGSGKTTLSKLIMGIIKPRSGSIKLFGKEIANMSLGQVGETMGYVFQYPERQLFASSVMEQLTFPLIFQGIKKEEAIEKAQEMIRIFELTKVKNSYPFFLSYGEKRRLAIASVLMHNPKYLILDEPTASLDKDRIAILSGLLNNLKNKKIGMLIISHNDDFIKN